MIIHPGGVAILILGPRSGHILILGVAIVIHPGGWPY